MSVPVTVTYLTHDKACQRPRQKGAACTCKPEPHRTMAEAKQAGGDDTLRVEITTTLLPYRREGRESQASRHLRSISD